jgi:hypothetical protein
MSPTIISAQYSNPEHTGAILVTQERGAVAVSEIDRPALWAEMRAWGTPSAYVEPVAPTPAPSEGERLIEALVAENIIPIGKKAALLARLKG